MKITIIDGQGGKMGKAVIEQLKKAHPDIKLYAIGTNTIATSAMLKAYKILIPANRCNHYIAGCVNASLGEYIRMVCEKVDIILSGSAPYPRHLTPPA